MKHHPRLLSPGIKETLWYSKAMSILLVSLLMTLYSCSKKDRPGTETTSFTETTAVAEQILKIAPSEQKFNEWTQTVLKNKLGSASPYTVEKISFTEIDQFKLAEVTIKSNGIAFNFYIGTLFEFVQAPELNRYVLKPETDIASPARTLIFSSGKSTGDISIDRSHNSVYTIKTNERNLFFLGAI